MDINHFKIDHLALRDHAKMKEVLRDPNAEGPKNHYYMIRGGSDIKNCTVWEFGKVGGEYIKTYGHYHVGDLDETYWIIWGEGIALLQKRAVDSMGRPIDDQIEDFQAIKVRAGDKVYMPKDYGHLLVNTGNTYFITMDDSPVYFTDVNPISLPGHADYEPVKKLQGFAYYVVEENGQPKLVKNPKYQKVPEVEITTAK
jgi:oxalate decarboxylase/phosphoglucose isomerase-like protein (cupin superfamily)